MLGLCVQPRPCDSGFLGNGLEWTVGAGCCELRVLWIGVIPCMQSSVETWHLFPQGPHSALLEEVGFESVGEHAGAQSTLRSEQAAVLAGVCLCSGCQRGLPRESRGLQVSALLASTLLALSWDFFFWTC